MIVHCCWYFSFSYTLNFLLRRVTCSYVVEVEDSAESQAKAAGLAEGSMDICEGDEQGNKVNFYSLTTGQLSTSVSGLHDT